MGTGSIRGKSDLCLSSTVSIIYLCGMLSVLLVFQSSFSSPTRSFFSPPILQNMPRHNSQHFKYNHHRRSNLITPGIKCIDANNQCTSPEKMFGFQPTITCSQLITILYKCAGDCVTNSEIIDTTGLDRNSIQLQIQIRSMRSSISRPLPLDTRALARRCATLTEHNSTLPNQRR